MASTRSSGKTNEDDKDLVDEKARFRETGDIRYLVIALGRWDQPPDWALQECRRYSDAYKASPARFDDRALGKYEADGPRLLAMAALMAGGRGPWSAANRVARHRKTPEAEKQIESEARRLYNIWKRAPIDSRGLNRWQHELIVRFFIRSDKGREALFRYLATKQGKAEFEEVRAQAEKEFQSEGLLPPSDIGAPSAS